MRSENLGLKLVDGSKYYSTNYNVKYTFGGKNSVAKNAGTRLGGKDRFQTSRLINYNIANISEVAVANGYQFADALSATNILVSTDQSTAVMLVANSIKTDDLKFLKNIDCLHIIGGSVNKNVVSRITGKPNNVPKKQAPSLGKTYLSVEEIQAEYGYKKDENSNSIN